MFNTFSDTHVVEASDADLLAAMGEEAAPAKGKTKSTDKGSDTTKKSDDANGEEKTKGAKSTSKTKASDKSSKDTTATKNVSDMSNDDLEAALGLDDDDDDENPDVDDENETDDEEKDTDEDKKDDDDDKKDDDEDKADETGDLSTNDFLKARVNLLIEKGEWVEWEGRDAEKEEWDEDSFAEMELKQREYQKTVMREEILDSYGPIGRSIAEHIGNGGNPDELIDIFKEQQKVEAMSIDTEEGQKAVVYKYATEFQRMKPNAARRYIDGLIADKELESVSKEAKEDMEKDFKQQAIDLKQQQIDAVNEQKRQAKERTDKFVSDVNAYLKSASDISADEKKEIQKVLTVFNKKLSNGAEVNEFYFKLADFRKELPNYINLVRFVLNPKKFAKEIENKGKTDATKKAFSLVRTANKTKTAKSVDVSKTGEAPKKVSGFRLTP